MDTSNQNLQRVEEAMDAMRRAMVAARERLGEGLQLTRTQMEILLILVHEPQTTGELARRLFITQSAVTQTIDTLVRRDLIERHPDVRDRRITRLEIGASGRELTDNLSNLRHKHMASLLSQLTENEIEVLISVTEKMTAQFELTKPSSRV